MATRPGPRSFTLQTPSRVCATDRSGRGAATSFSPWPSALHHLELVLHRLHAVHLLRHGLGALLLVGGLDLALQRDDALVAVDVDAGQRLQADVGGERA